MHTLPSEAIPLQSSCGRAAPPPLPPTVLSTLLDQTGLTRQIFVLEKSKHKHGDPVVEEPGHRMRPSKMSAMSWGVLSLVRRNSQFSSSLTGLEDTDHRPAEPSGPSGQTNQTQRWRETH